MPSEKFAISLIFRQISDLKIPQSICKSSFRMFTTTVIISPFLFFIFSSIFPTNGTLNRIVGIFTDLGVFISFKKKDTLSRGKSLGWQFLDLSFRTNLKHCLFSATNNLFKLSYFERTYMSSSSSISQAIMLSTGISNSLLDFIVFGVPLQKSFLMIQ